MRSSVNPSRSLDAPQRLAFSNLCRSLVVLMLMSIMSISPIDAETAASLRMPAGYSRVEALLGGELTLVHVYRPKRCRSGPLLIVFPGYERDSDTYLKHARGFARAACMTALAPEVDRDAFPRSRYQRAGVRRKGNGVVSDRCMGRFITELVAFARQMEERPDAPFILFGHSAGAQMLSRVSAYCPVGGAGRIVVANPSAHVAPTLEEHVPYGFASYASQEEKLLRLRSYLAQPITIYLGTDDVGRHRLVQDAASRRQGQNRYARGLHVFHAARIVADSNAWPFNWRLVEAASVGHSGRGMLAAPELPDALLLGKIAKWPAEQR